MYRSDTMLQKKEFFNLYLTQLNKKGLQCSYIQIHRDSVLVNYGFLLQIGLVQLWNKSITKLSPTNSQLNQCTANANSDFLVISLWILVVFRNLFPDNPCQIMIKVSTEEFTTFLLIYEAITLCPLSLTTTSFFLHSNLDKSSLCELYMSET